MVDIFDAPLFVVVVVVIVDSVVIMAYRTLIFSVMVGPLLLNGNYAIMHSLCTINALFMHLK